MKQQKRVQPTKKNEEFLSYLVVVRDKKGQVMQRISAPSHSYVEQWNQMLNSQAKQGANTIKKTDGSSGPVSGHQYNFKMNAAIGYTATGLRVGKGSTAVAIDDYALETPCEEGTGLDEFNHQAVTFTAPAVVGPTCSFTAKRIFVNNSGATISGIRELACYNSPYVLGFRDVLPGAVSVPHGGTITVIYTIAVTV